MKEKGLIIKTLEANTHKNQSITIEQLVQSDRFDVSNTVYEWLGASAYQTVLASFLAEYSNLTVQEETLTHKEKSTLVHMLKGACGNIGAVRLFSRCEDIEESLRASDISIKPLLDELSEDISILEQLN